MNIPHIRLTPRGRRVVITAVVAGVGLALIPSWLLVAAGTIAITTVVANKTK